MPQRPAYVEHNVALDQLPGERFQEALRFWQAAKGNLVLPPQRAIEPKLLPRGLIANVAVVTVEHRPMRFRYRIVGTAIVRGWGEDITGKYTDDIPNGAQMTERFAGCVKNRSPYYSQGPLLYAVNDFKSFGLLAMPFANETGEVSRLLLYNEFY